MGIVKAGTSSLFPAVQFEFLSHLMRGLRPDIEPLQVGGRSVRLLLARNPRARRYILRVRPDGAARVTIPRGGSVAEARRFVVRHAAWIERQLLRQASRPSRLRGWNFGTEILMRGVPVRLERPTGAAAGEVQIGKEVLPATPAADDLRPLVERHLRELATRELPPRVLELAATHQVTVRRVSVRNQRSRWGSCSRRGTISLNWRLIQTPDFVRDYIILHELMHLRELNHSPRFWAEVERVCPDYLAAEQWLKQHTARLR